MADVPTGRKVPGAHATEEQVLAEVAALRRAVESLHHDLWRRHSAVAAQPGARERSARSAEAYVIFFGGFALHQSGAPVPLGRNRAVGGLFRYLAAHAGRVVPRDQLLELLWPEADQSRAAHRLHVAVSGLRRLLAAGGIGKHVVQMEDDAYVVPADAVERDCDRFEQAYRDGRRRRESGDRDGAAGAFRRALELYAGDFLADDPYTEWTHQPRAHFAELRLRALTFLCDHALQTDNPGASAEYAQEILATDGLRERAHRCLMRAQYRLGQRACAVRQYQICAALLGRELGVPPSQLTQDLYGAICDDAELPSEPPDAA